LVYGKDVTLLTHGLDKYGRTLADVLLPNGTNVNHTLVKDGWCWWYRKYAPGGTVLEGLEDDARQAKKGLWADPQSPCRRGSGGGDAGASRSPVQPGARPGRAPGVDTTRSGTLGVLLGGVGEGPG
jgi:endonuclease YncB( thermonuclease family)